MKPDPISLQGERSDREVSSDKLQEELVGQRQRVFGITFWLVIAGEVVLWYFDTPVWILIVLPLMWVGFLIHTNALLVLHELWEINDQLSGRKDGFGRLLRGRENDES